jgi:hypothetical protein
MLKLFGSRVYFVHPFSLFCDGESKVNNGERHFLICDEVLARMCTNFHYQFHAISFLKIEMI